MRRDHLKYLGLIEAVTLLHQHQRELRVAVDEGEQVEHLVVSLADIGVANRLSAEVLGRSLDELPPQTRRFLLLVEEMVSAACDEQGVERPELRFSRADVRRFTGWSYDQVRVHLDRLAEMEYVLVHRGRRGQSFVYELLYDGEGQEGEPFLLGLIDVERLSQAAEASTATPAEGPALGTDNGSLGGGKTEFGGTLGPHLAPIGVPWGGAENGRGDNNDGPSPAESGEEAEKTHIAYRGRLLTRRSSYRRRSPYPRRRRLGREGDEDPAPAPPRTGQEGAQAPRLDRSSQPGRSGRASSRLARG